MNNLSKVTNHFISRSKIIIWLALHGCDIKGIDFFPKQSLRFIAPFPYLKKGLNWESIKDNMSRIKIESYYYNLIDYSFDKSYQAGDWQEAKRLSSAKYVVIRHPWEETYTNEDLDDIPF